MYNLIIYYLIFIFSFYFFITIDWNATLRGLRLSIFRLGAEGLGLGSIKSSVDWILDLLLRKFLLVDFAFGDLWSKHRWFAVAWIIGLSDF